MQRKEIVSLLSIRKLLLSFKSFKGEIDYLLPEVGPGMKTLGKSSSDESDDFTLESSHFHPLPVARQQSHNRLLSTEVEWIPTKSRTLVGTLSSFFFTFGQMVLAGIAHSLRDWRKLQVAVCAPFFLFFLYSW